MHFSVCSFGCTLFYFRRNQHEPTHLRNVRKHGNDQTGRHVRVSILWKKEYRFLLKKLRKGMKKMIYIYEESFRESQNEQTEKRKSPILRKEIIKHRCDLVDVYGLKLTGDFETFVPYYNETILKNVYKDSKEFLKKSKKSPGFFIQYTSEFEKKRYKAILDTVTQLRNQGYNADDKDISGYLERKKGCSRLLLSKKA